MEPYCFNHVLPLLRPWYLSNKVSTFGDDVVIVAKRIDLSSSAHCFITVACFDFCHTFSDNKIQVQRVQDLFDLSPSDTAHLLKSHSPRSLPSQSCSSLYNRRDNFVHISGSSLMHRRDFVARKNTYHQAFIQNLPYFVTCTIYNRHVYNCLQQHPQGRSTDNNIVSSRSIIMDEGQIVTWAMAFRANSSHKFPPPRRIVCIILRNKGGGSLNIFYTCIYTREEWKEPFLSIKLKFSKAKSLSCFSVVSIVSDIKLWSIQYSLRNHDRDAVRYETVVHIFMPTNHAKIAISDSYKCI